MSSRSIPCFSAIAKRSSTPCRGVQVLSFAPFFPFLYREEEKEHHPRRDETNRLRFDRLVRARVAKFDWSVSVVEDFYWWLLNSGTIRSSTHTSHRARAWPNNNLTYGWGVMQIGRLCFTCETGVTDTLSLFHFCFSFSFTKSKESAICRVEGSSCGRGRRIDPTYSLRVVKGD